jgi:hypothetical protein
MKTILFILLLLPFKDSEFKWYIEVPSDYAAYCKNKNIMTVYINTADKYFVDVAEKRNHPNELMIQRGDSTSILNVTLLEF